MGDPIDPSTGLPKDAPADLRAFLNCTGATLTLKNGKQQWLSDALPPGLSPEVSITPGPGATGTLTIGSGYLSLSLPMSIVNGQLNVDASGLPDALGAPLTNQFDNLNAWFKKNGKQFGNPTFAKGQVTLAKVPFVAPAQQVPAGQGAAAPAGAPQGAGGKPGAGKPGAAPAGPGAVPPPPAAAPQGQGKPAQKPPAGWPGLIPTPLPPQQLPPPTPGTIRMSVVGSTDPEDLNDIFNVAPGGDSPSDASGTKSQTAPSESAPVRTGSTGWMGNRPMAGPDDGSEPAQNVAVPGPVDEPDEVESTPPPPSTRRVAGSLMGVVGVIVVGLIAMLLVEGGGLPAGALSTPTPALPGGGGPVGLPGFSAGPTGTPRPGGGGTEGSTQPGGSVSPLATQPPPPPFVIISANTITFGPASQMDNQKACHDGWTVTFTIRIVGIQPGTPVVMQAHGPGAPPSLTFVANPGVDEAQSFHFGPGGGAWADQIVTIGGQTPPSAGRTAATVFQCTV